MGPTLVYGCSDDTRRPGVLSECGWCEPRGDRCNVCEEICLAVEMQLIIRGAEEGLRANRFPKLSRDAEG